MASGVTRSMMVITSFLLVFLLVYLWKMNTKNNTEGFLIEKEEMGNPSHLHTLVTYTHLSHMHTCYICTPVTYAHLSHTHTCYICIVFSYLMYILSSAGRKFVPKKILTCLCDRF